MLTKQRLSDLPQELAERQKLARDYPTLGDTGERRLEVYILRSKMISERYPEQVETLISNSK